MRILPIVHTLRSMHQIHINDTYAPLILPMIPRHLSYAVGGVEAEDQTGALKTERG